MYHSIVYKNQDYKAAIMRLYDQKLASLSYPTTSIMVTTSVGDTHVLRMGDPQLPALVVFHGINAGSPITLEAMQHLSQDFCLYGIDTIGQATRSAEVRLPLTGKAIGNWIVEVLDGLKIEKTRCVGVSYGAFLLQKLMQVAPERIVKAAFVVPSGLVNGPFWPSMKKLSLPLIRFQLTKSQEALKRFISAFHTELEANWVELHFQLLTGTKMDYRRPPLLKPADVQQLQAPVYAMVAEDDVFFPGDAALARCEKLFPNFAGSHVLKGAKHMPTADTFGEIQAQLITWLR